MAGKVLDPLVHSLHMLADVRLPRALVQADRALVQLSQHRHGLSGQAYGQVQVMRVSYWGRWLLCDDRGSLGEDGGALDLVVVRGHRGLAHDHGGGAVLGDDHGDDLLHRGDDAGASVGFFTLESNVMQALGKLWDPGRH